MAQKDSSLSKYTIPKRRVEDKKEDDYVQKSILDNSSYNMNYGSYQNQQGKSYNPRSGPPNTVQPIAQNIWNTLSTIKEKPKGERRNMYPINMFPTVILTEPLNFYRETLWGDDKEAEEGNQKRSPSNNPLKPGEFNIENDLNSQSAKKEKRRISEEVDMFREMVPDVEDQTLPKELTSQFQPLYCKLCSAQLSSNVMAKLHYKSKNHEKKIRKYLVDYSEKTGEPLHKRAKTVATAKPENEKNPSWFYCEICDLPLTGKMHADSHYMGKNHQKVVKGHKAPAGRGFYDPEGKWVRQGKAKNSTDDTFGLDFRAKSSEEAVPSKPPTVELTPGKFQCSICNVGATCQEQIDMHFKGQKHQKKLKHFGLIPPKLKKGPKSETDILSVYITPSGGFYCPICNLSLNSEMQFKVHLGSKGHAKKSAEPKSS